jgi:predicted DNA-binding transcriptional regulator AlpA
MTLDEFRSHWERRRDDFAQLRAQIDAATLIDQLLADLALATAEHHTALLTLTQAAHVSGYSADHLGRLVRIGELTNYGRSHAPRVRSGDLPRRLRRSVGAPSDYDPAADAWSIKHPQAQEELADTAHSRFSASSPMLAAKDAAVHIGLAPQTLAKMRLEGSSPPYFKVGRRVLYKREELDAWLALKRRRSTSDAGDPRTE